MENLRPNTINDIQRITRRINDGKIDRRVIALLLIKLRGLYGSDSKLVDIANYVAHDYRNQGESYKLAEVLMQSIGNFFTPNQEGGHTLTAPSNNEIASQKEICDELLTILTPFGAIEDRFQLRSFKIMCCIMENIEEAVMYVKQTHRPYLIECKVSALRIHDCGVKYLTFETIIIGDSEDGNIKMTGTVAARLFLQAVPEGAEPYDMGLEFRT